MGGGLRPSPPEALQIVQSPAGTMPKILHTSCKKMKAHQVCVWGGGGGGRVERLYWATEISRAQYIFYHIFYIFY